MNSVLLIDDELDIVSTLEMVLTLEGYEVRSAFNGQEALQMLQKGFFPGLIISDIMMPIMSGYELIRALKGNPTWEKIPVILVSAALPDPGQVSKEDYIAFVRKPFDLERLLAAIRRVMKK